MALDRKPPLELFAAVGAGDVEAPAGRGLRGLVASAPTDIYWTAAYRSLVDKWRCPFVHCSRAPSGYRIERLIFGCEGIVSNRLGSLYRSGRSDHWLKIKNPAAPAVRRAEEDWGSKRRGANE